MIRAALALLLALALAVPASAAPRASYNDLEDELMCVNCNVSLNIAESTQADQEKAELRELVAAGLTKQAIKDRMVAIYGDDVLAEPKRKGFALFAWIVPIGAAVALIALGVVLLPRWRARRAEAAAAEAQADAEPPLDPADAARVDADMAKLGV